MAPVEYRADCIELNKTLIVEHIDVSKVIEFSAYDRTDVMVCCNLADNRGMILITTEIPEIIGAIVVDDSLEPDTWLEADIKNPIEFTQNQYVIIYSEDDPTEICVHHFDKSAGPKKLTIITRDITTL